MKAKVVNPVLGARLQEARKAAGLSQPELARAVGMRQSAIAEIEGGRVKRPKKLREIAQTVRRSEEWLLGEVNGAVSINPAPEPVAAPRTQAEALERQIERIDRLEADVRLLAKALHPEDFEPEERALFQRLQRLADED